MGKETSSSKINHIPFKLKTRTQVTINSELHSEKLLFPCVWCEKSFKTRRQLENHLLLHTNEKPFFCRKCPETFSNLSNLHWHAYQKHGDGNGNKCEKCNKSFYSPYALNLHRRVHSGEKPYSCTICGKNFSQKGGLSTHFVRFHSETRLNCPKCPKAFRHKLNLNSHIKLVHSALRPYRCEICGNSYKLKTRRDQHISSHLNEKPYKCTKCGKRFAYSAGLRYHLKAYHENKRNVKCSKCPCSFVDNSHLKVHFLKNHCDPMDRSFECVFCAQKFAQKDQLEHHIRSHVKEKPFFCSSCPISYGYKKSLKTHQHRAHQFPVGKFEEDNHARIRTCESRFECEICKRKFRTKNQLVIHSSNECTWIQFTCIWCDKTFKKVDSLTNHLRLHTNERPYDCDECPEVFSCFSQQSKHNFRKHGRGEGKKCKVCHKILSTPSALEIHMRFHTGEKAFSCSICGMAFAQKGGLTRHSAVHSKGMDCR